MQNGADIAKDQVEQVGEQAEHLQFLRHLDRQARDLARQLDFGVHDADLFGDILHDRAHRHVVFEHQNDVLAVRHEHQIVGEEAVQQRAHVGVEIARQPGVGIQARGVDERADHGRLVRIAMQ